MISDLIRKNRSLAWVWAGSMAFIILNALLVRMEIFYLPALPILLFVVLLAFVSVDKLVFLIVFFVPLSVPLSYLMTDLSVDLYLPTEPLLAGVMIIFFLKYLQGNVIDLKILRHPVTLAIYFNLAWIFITTITSTDPVVSIKFLIARIWFLVSFYFLAAAIFQKVKNMKIYIWMYVISFVFVIGYTIIRHAGYGLDSQVMAHSVMKPFYKDHTSYGAVLALVIPVLIGLFSNIPKDKVTVRFLMLALITYFLVAIVFSYTRAAWLSLIAAAGIWLIIRLKIPLQFVVVGIAAIIGLFFAFHTEILINLEKNRQQSSGDFAEHVQSMTNVTTDQSNLERINRWSSAIRMWEERPVFGFGPGTYQFEYAPYQRSFERTEISTNFGNLGNAHSEYLGPLSESGILGMLSMLIIVFTTITTGIRVHFKTKNPEVKCLSLAILVALVSYYIHGFLNNFLDTDKVSALFWGFTAMLVAMDVYHRKEEEKTSFSGELNPKD